MIRTTEALRFHHLVLTVTSLIVPSLTHLHDKPHLQQTAQPGHTPISEVVQAVPGVMGV